MPRLSTAVPKYRRHKPSRQAVVTLSGVDHYLGPFGSRASVAQYNLRIKQWLVAGRTSSHQLTVIELIVAYMKHAKKHYRKRGQLTSEFGSLKSALKFVPSLHGRTPAKKFGPLALHMVMESMIVAGLARQTINQHAGSIRRMFRWAVSRELLKPKVLVGLTSVAGLEAGRTDARETDPVTPVDGAVIDRTLLFMPTVVADLVKLQRLLGCRPSEACVIRPVDLDGAGNIGRYTPEGHKCEHRSGRSAKRVIFVGQRAQSILLRYLARDPEEYCFRPIDSEQKRRAAASAARVVPITCGTKPGDRRTANRKRSAGACYTTASYRRAIARACDAAFPPSGGLVRQDGETQNAWLERLTDIERAELARWQSDHRWAPNRMRHSAGTEVREKFGLEVASALLGHTKMSTTEIYAQRSATLACEAAEKIG